MAYEQVQKPSSSFVPVQKKVSELAPSASRVQAKDVTAGEQEQIPKVSTPATDANWLMKHPLFKGNQFLQRVVAPASESESLESEEETLQRQEEGNEAATPYSLPVQAKLTIGEPGDKYEQEADRVASQVVKQINSPEAASSSQGQSVQRREEPVEELQRQPSISDLQRSPLPLEVQREAMPAEEELQAKSLLQRREAYAGGEASTDLDTAINSARGGGQSLDAGLQRSMGQAMGADFSGVKVHTDAQSDQLNQSIQAKAFTTGQDVFFRQGEYNPGSRGGQELLAHELTHVVQQNGGAVQRMTSENESTDRVKVGSIDDLSPVIREIKKEKGWDGSNYGGAWECNMISDLLCKKVAECQAVTSQGNVLVRGGKIPGGDREGNTKGLRYWFFDEYHAYVRVGELGLYDPTFNRPIKEGDVITGEKKSGLTDTGVDFDYIRFGEMCGAYANEGDFFMYESLNALSEAVGNPKTEVGEFWKEDDDSDSE
jgi:hypothetical protein